jgi:hypothetical protein
VLPRAARFFPALAVVAAAVLPVSPTAAETFEEAPISVGPDLTRPSVAGLRLAPAAFRSAGSGASVASGLHGGVGTKVSFEISEAGRVSFGVQERKLGRRIGGTCRDQSAASQGQPQCVRFVPLPGGFAVDVGEGVNSVFFSGRLGGRSLAAASYRLIALARDGAGNESLPGSAEFSILAR